MTTESIEGEHHLRAPADRDHGDQPIDDARRREEQRAVVRQGAPAPRPDVVVGGVEEASPERDRAASRGDAASCVVFQSGVQRGNDARFSSVPGGASGGHATMATIAGPASRSSAMASSARPSTREHSGGVAHASASIIAESAGGAPGATTSAGTDQAAAPCAGAITGAVDPPACSSWGSVIGVSAGAPRLRGPRRARRETWSLPRLRIRSRDARRRASLGFPTPAWTSLLPLSTSSPPSARRSPPDPTPPPRRTAAVHGRTASSTRARTASRAGFSSASRSAAEATRPRADPCAGASCRSAGRGASIRSPCSSPSSSSARPTSPSTRGLHGSGCASSSRTRAPTSCSPTPPRGATSRPPSRGSGGPFACSISTPTRS